MTKMVFWRYTCSRPCLGTAEIPGRNGHVTSFITRYGNMKSGFHGYPLLGGTRTAMRSFFNFTKTDSDWSNPERIRQVEIDLSAPPWGAVSMMKLTSENTTSLEDKIYYVGFLKWYHSGIGFNALI